MNKSVLILDSNTRVVINRIAYDVDNQTNLVLPQGVILSPRHDGDIGWTLTQDNEWVNPNPPQYEPHDIKVRRMRDVLLERSDIFMIPDFPISETVREQWRQYRQALRDIPLQSGFPNDVIWPTKPE